MKSWFDQALGIERCPDASNEMSFTTLKEQVKAGRDMSVADNDHGQNQESDAPGKNVMQGTS